MKTLKELGKTAAKWVLKQVVETSAVKAIVATALAVVGAWAIAGKSYLLGQHSVYGWVILSSLLLHGFASFCLVRWFWKRRHRPRWIEYQSLRWLLTEHFFREGEQLIPKNVANLNRYIKGPFCPQCQKEFTYPVRQNAVPDEPMNFTCTCGTYPMFNGTANVGLANERVALIAACVDAQARLRLRKLSYL